MWHAWHFPCLINILNSLKIYWTWLFTITHLMRSHILWFSLSLTHFVWSTCSPLFYFATLPFFLSLYFYSIPPFLSHALFIALSLPTHYFPPFFFDSLSFSVPLALSSSLCWSLKQKQQDGCLRNISCQIWWEYCQNIKCKRRQRLIWLL